MQLERSYSRHLKVETYYLRALSQRSTCLFHHGNLLSKPVDPIFSMNFNIKSGQMYKFYAVFFILLPNLYEKNGWLFNYTGPGMNAKGDIHIIIC